MASANEATTIQTGSVSSKAAAGTSAFLRNAALEFAPKFRPTLTEEEAVVQSRMLRALADPTRLRILNLLSRHEGEVCVCEIVENFPLEQPTISHHLRILRDVGLVDFHKKGLWAYYYVCREALNRARDMITNLA